MIWYLCLLPWQLLNEVIADTECAIVVFVCQLHESGTAVMNVTNLGWKLFTKKQLESLKLPPTRGALQEVIASHMASDQEFHHQLPPSIGYGRRTEGD